VSDVVEPPASESAPAGPTKTAPSRARSSGSGHGTPPETFTERFARILTNSPELARANARRERGFLIVVREAAQLQRLQGLCTDPSFAPQISCLTARYRVRAGPAVGTILGALAADLRLMRGSVWDPKDAAGDLLPAPGPSPHQGAWARLLGLPAWQELLDTGLPVLERDAVLGVTWMRSFLSALRPQDALPTTTRLVILAEVDPVASNPVDWTEAIEAILPLLPQAVGVLVSGAPTDLRRPRRIGAGDPHFALVSAAEIPPSDPGDPSYHYADSALSGDQPADQDVLEVSRFADGLARLVLHKDTKPLTIGIHGPWGSGKSSFMQLIKDDLFRHAPSNKRNGYQSALQTVEENLVEYQPENWNRHSEAEPVADFLVDAETKRRQFLGQMEKAARRDVITVDFNAWRYDNETQIWAGLASEITRALESAMPWYRRLTLPIQYALGRRTSEVIISLVVPVVAVIIGLVIVSRLAISEAAGNQILGDLAVLTTALPGGILVIGVLIWRTAVVAVPVSRRILGYARGPDYSEQTGLQSKVIDDLDFVSRQLRPMHIGRPRLPKLRNRGSIETLSWPLPKPRPAGPRIVVFIDDLDRCSDDKVVDILQAINLILGKSSFYVFLGMDTEMIYRAIDVQYHVEKGDGRATFAESYLRKIVQLSFHLPTADTDDRFALVRRMFSPAARRAFGASDVDGSEHRSTNAIVEDAFTLAAGLDIRGASSSVTTRQEAADLATGQPVAETGLGDIYWFDRSILLPPRVAVLMEVEDTEEELEAFREFTPFMSPNPREIKRLVNVHRLVRILLVRQESPLTPTVQRKLVAWLIFSARWPDLVDDILRIARNGGVGDCLLALSVDQPDARVRDDLVAFSTKLGIDGMITSDDLKELQLLPEAARISQMVRDIPAEPPPPVTSVTIRN
jgi:hypothetical protein